MNASKTRIRADARVAEARRERSSHDESHGVSLAVRRVDTEVP